MPKEQGRVQCGWNRVNEGRQMEKWAGWLLKHLITHDEFKFLTKDISYPLRV